MMPCYSTWKAAWIASWAWKTEGWRLTAPSYIHFHHASEPWSTPQPRPGHCQAQAALQCGAAEKIPALGQRLTGCGSRCSSSSAQPVTRWALRPRAAPGPFKLDIGPNSNSDSESSLTQSISLSLADSELYIIPVSTRNSNQWAHLVVVRLPSLKQDLKGSSPDCLNGDCFFFDTVSFFKVCVNIFADYLTTCVNYFCTWW